MTMTLDETADDVRLRNALETINPEPEVVEVVHQYTKFNDGYSVWNIRLRFDKPMDVGTAVNKIDRVDHMKTENRHAPRSATVRPDGSIAVMVKAGPGVTDTDK